MKHSVKKAKPGSGAKSAQIKEFSVRKKKRPLMAELYRQAEVRLRIGRTPSKKVSTGQEMAFDPQRQLHELQVHQIELEMQNAEIQESRNRMELLLEKFTDLYDFAPVGYFTLSADSTIQQANLTGAVLLGVERGRLVGQRFGHLFVGHHPVVHIVAQCIHVEVVPVANLHPDA